MTKDEQIEALRAQVIELGGEPDPELTGYQTWTLEQLDRTQHESSMVRAVSHDPRPSDHAMAHFRTQAISKLTSIRKWLTEFEEKIDETW